jgi:hypothetical protein
MRVRSYSISRVNLKMRTGSRLLMVSAIAIFFLSFAIVPVIAATGTPQYATYNITGNAKGHSFNVIVNESVAPSSANGMSDVTLQIASMMGNFSYSKIMNSSQVILPYFPTIANQSFTYQFHNYSISATIDQAGSGSVSYNGKTYTVSNYTFNVGVSGNMTQMSAKGSASVLPSGLVYSAWIVANGTNTINIQLLGTNLPLTSQSGSSSTTTSIAVGGSAASIVAGVGAIVLYRRKNSSQAGNSTEAKPLYHVD